MSQNAENLILEQILSIDLSTYNRFVAKRGAAGFDMAEGWDIVEKLQTKPKGKLVRLQSRKSVGKEYDISKVIDIMVKTAELLPDGEIPSIVLGSAPDSPTIRTEEVIVKLMRVLIKMSIQKNEELYLGYKEAFEDILRLGLTPETMRTSLTSKMIIKAFKPQTESKDLITSGIAKGILMSLGEEVI